MREGERVAVCHPEFLEDLQYWVETDRRTAKRLLELVRPSSTVTRASVCFL